MLRTLLFVLISVSLFAEEPPRQIRESWQRHYNAGNAEAVVALYAGHAAVVSDGGTLRGRDAIRAWVQNTISQGSRLESIVASDEKASGTLAYSTGHTRRWVGDELHKGQFLIVLEKIGGEWKIVHHFSLNVK